jgi:protein arginine N-methyltransferase 1
VNEAVRSALGPRAMLSQPQTLAVLDYRTITEPDLDSTVELVADRPATAHGLQMWFDAEIADGLTFSNAPGEPPLVYGRTFLPFEQPVRLRPGDRVAARIRARLFGGQYILFWNSTIIDGATGTIQHSFAQSELKSRVLSPRALAPFAADHVPQASTALALDRDCLTLVDDQRSLIDIALEVMARHPGHFSSEAEALGHVGRVLRHYTQASGER